MHSFSESTESRGVGTNIDSIIYYAAANKDKITDCFGKHLAIPIGFEERGKSTTINALRGILFDYNQNDDSNLIPLTTLQKVAPMGTEQENGWQCTVYPEAYPSEHSPDEWYVDTPGFFGTDKDPNITTASTLLLDCVLSNARQVKVVYLENSLNFINGVCNFNDMLKLLGRVVAREDVPVFFLFNQYRPRANNRTFYYMTPEEQHDFIYQELNKAAKKHIEQIKKKVLEHPGRISHILQMVSNRFRRPVASSSSSSGDSASSLASATSELSSPVPSPASSSSSLSQNAPEEFNGSDLQQTEELTEVEQEQLAEQVEQEAEQDPLSEEDQAKLRFVSILENSFKNGWYGYIDPTSTASVSWLRERLNNLPNAPKDRLHFGKCSAERIAFNQQLEYAVVNDYTPKTRLYTLALRYPPDMIQRYIDHHKQLQKEHQDNLESCRSSNITQELVLRYDDNRRRQSEDLSRRIADLTREKEQTQQRLESFKQGPLVLHRQIPFFRTPTLFRVWRNFPLKYDGEEPFAKVVEDLQYKTQRRSIRHFPADNYTSVTTELPTEPPTRRTTFLAKSPDLESNQFEVLYSTATNKGIALFWLSEAAVSIVSGVGSLITLKLIPLLYALSYKVAGVNVDKLFGTCAGNVEFYVRPEVANPAHESFLQRSVAQLEAQIRTLENEKDSLTQIPPSSLEHNIQFHLDYERGQVDILSHIQEALIQIRSDWTRQPPRDEPVTSLGQRMNDCFTLIPNISPDYLATPGLVSFMEAYQQFLEVSSPEEADAASSASSNEPQSEADLIHSFNSININDITSN